jgi:hypothetical protein
VKIIKIIRILGLLVLLVAALAGCGGGGGGSHQDSSANYVYFTMASTYEVSDKTSSAFYSIPSGAPITFYTVTEANFNEVMNDSTGTATCKPDYTFSGTTGNSTFKFKLPDTLKDQKRNIFAVITNGTTFDLNGKTKNEIINAMSSVIWGNSTGEVTLSNGSNIALSFSSDANVTHGTALPTIQFTMPVSYYDYTADLSGGTSGITSKSIQSGREFKIYFHKSSGGTTFSGDLVYTDETDSASGSYSFTVPIPSSYSSATSIWVDAIVTLDGSFDINGKTKDQLIQAIKDKKVLFGKAQDGGDEITLPHSTTVPFTFVGNVN